jgi:hypothetical protein
VAKKAAVAEADPLDDLLASKGTDKPSKAAEKDKPAEPSKTMAASDLDLLGAAPQPAPEKAAGPPRDRSLDELLDTAVDKKGGAAAADLPATPTRADVLKAMRDVEDEVRACAQGQDAKGTAAVAFTVAGPTGRISGVRVTGIQGEAGSCIARAVRAAQFPKFAKSDFKVNYPYRL